MDTTVRAFLDRHRGSWRDLNVPESDGRILHDLIVRHTFTQALEIGTSTGHSGIWIAWALAKTGGRLTTVEIDPAVINVARDYFAFRQSERVRVFEADGRVFVKRALRENRRYDLIMLDAFDHEYIPEHLLTQEFLREVRALLADDGVLAANTFSSSRLYDHESTTYASVFPGFFNLKRENRVILAKLGAQPTSEDLKSNSVLFEEAFNKVGISASRQLPLFSGGPDWNPRARVLTDQYSPANLLNRE